MRVKISAFSVEDKQQQQFSVQARRRHVIFEEELVRGIDGLFELHGEENLPQRTRRTQRLISDISNEVRYRYEL
jgi:hypothetical protein